MEYRREPRFEANQPVAVRNLEEVETAIPGRLVNLSKKGVQLVLSRPIAVGTVVKVEWESTLLLGEVIYSAPRGTEFVVGLELEAALYDTDALATMMGKERAPVVH